jgi:polygalacturonase
MERRDFLKKAAQGALAAPMVAMMPGVGEAQEAKKAAASAAPAQKAVTPAGPKVMLNVRDYGATGDGKTKDTLALQQTIERCSRLGGGEVVVPAGDYLTGALALFSGVTLRVDDGAALNGSTDQADYTVAQVRWEGKWIKGYLGFISATDAQDIAIVGKGKIVGSPQERGRVDRATGMRLQALLEFVNCKNVLVEDVDTQQFGMWSTHPVYCENVTFRNVTFKSGADGIDVDSCKHVVIDGCNFDTGDDCISLKSGRGEEANTINRVCEDVRISNCTFVDHGFACIGIGSETSAGVRNVRVDHCKFVGARSHAVYIKSRPGRGAFVEDIVMTDLEVSGAQQGFLRLNNLNSGKQDEAPVPGDAGIPKFGNFTFRNVHITDESLLVAALEIHPKKPLDGFVLENVTGTCKKGISLANMKNVRLAGIKVTGYDGPLLRTYNVTGTGLAGAVKIDEADLPKVPDPVPEAAEPYKLH